MGEITISRNVFNVMRIAIGILGLTTLASMFLLEEEVDATAGHIASIVVDGKRLELQTVLQDEDTTGIAFVNRLGELTAYSSDGTPIDLCHGFGNGDAERKTCQIDAPIATLIGDMSKAPAGTQAGNESDADNTHLVGLAVAPGGTAAGGSHCGLCDNGWGTLVSCHLSNEKRKCHDGTHKSCDGPCD